MPMAYCILRVAKIKSRVSLTRALQHNTRERVPDNANPARANKNQIFGSSQEALARYTALLPEKVRKNAVHAVEFMVTFSPEAWSDKADAPKRRSEFLEKSLKWIQKALGGPQNVLNISIHGDERTPHLHAIMMPMRDGKLNARSFLGGSSAVMRQLQDRFYEEVGKSCGLERGRPREETGRRHITVGRFYAIGQDAVNKEIERQHALAPKRRSKEGGIER